MSGVYTKGPAFRCEVCSKRVADRLHHCNPDDPKAAPTSLSYAEAAHLFVTLGEAEIMRHPDEVLVILSHMVRVVSEARAARDEAAKSIEDGSRATLQRRIRHQRHELAILQKKPKRPPPVWCARPEGHDGDCSPRSSLREYGGWKPAKQMAPACGKTVDALPERGRTGDVVIS